MAGILVVAEIKEGQFRKVSFEIASEAMRCAKKLGLSVTGLVMGTGTKAIASELGKYGIPSVLVADDPSLEKAYLHSYAEIVEIAAKKIDASHLFFPATIFGKSLSAIIAAKLQTSALTDCVALRIENGHFLAQRPMYAGKTIATVTPLKMPVVASLRPNIFEIVQEECEAKLDELPVALNEKHRKTVILEKKAAEGKKVDLTEAAIIVSGGRGMKGPENFPLVEKLATALGGVVGASRAVVDAHWRPHEEQVGQTGKTVSPQLYVACGISGAVQHLAGMRTAKVIVAVNKDPDAPIFQIADYGIVGDVLEVLPKMIEEAEKIGK